MNPGESFIVNASRLQKCFDVSRQTLMEYRKAGMPRLARGKYDLEACWQWRWAHFAPEERRGSLSDERKQLVITQRRLKELQLKRAGGEVVEVKEVIQLIDRLVGSSQAKLLGLPTRVAVEILTCKNPREARDLLDKELRRILSDMSKGFEGAGMATPGALETANEHDGNGHRKRS